MWARNRALFFLVTPSDLPRHCRMSLPVHTDDIMSIVSLL